MHNFTPPCLDTTLSLTELGLTAIGQHHSKRHLTVLCLLADEHAECPGCAQRGRVRSTRIRRLVHPPVGLTAVTLAIRIRTFQCPNCRQRWSQSPAKACVGRSKLSRTARLWALKSVVIDKMSIHVIAQNLATSWNTVCTAVLDLGTTLLLADATRFDGVSTIGVDEHCWSHRGIDRWVTVIVDLTNRPARLIDIVPGRSAEVFRDWLQRQPDEFQAGIEHVAMDAFAGYKKAATQAVPDAVTVMDPFHVVALVGTKLDETRRRLQTEIHGRRGRSGDDLYGIRKTIRTRVSLLSDKQKHRLNTVFAADDHAALVVCWQFYQDTIAAYAAAPAKGKTIMAGLIHKLADTIPDELKELRSLRTTFQRRRADILAYFDHPGTSNGPTEAINGRLEHLRGIALGFRNRSNYLIRSLLHAGGMSRLLQPYL
ncbi:MULTISPECIES: ISL3 family transposase [Brevibacterium]|uniref:ISL3 family transposase n=4 Tax=Brevibacterium TaxID=1696 RepID=A0A2A3ZI82_BREAU|nr:MULTISPECIES: ISL3 family transposase [Brevibacterium]AGY35350.1 transposase family protein [Brevibacterium sp. Ap13]AZL06216.1 ISL3 family transposase [Brevibacterium aurantiacum]AZL07363.1 ISL3 family transposase [Brevibacterium aurantiacum]MCI4013178.1 ISL3 family transposase [Brevibacterium sp. ZH18]MDN5661712.1 ISL3 family transposase [Brevibacterium aurantiacum]